MDSNLDDLITIFEYRSYVDEGNLFDQFDSLWHTCEQTPLVAESYAAYRANLHRVKVTTGVVPCIRRKKELRFTDAKLESVVAIVAQEDSQMRRKTAEEMSMDIAFVVDCTSSMGIWIKEVLEKIEAVAQFAATDMPLVRHRYAFVGYRDFNDGDERLVIQNFTPSPRVFKAFLATVGACDFLLLFLLFPAQLTCT